ncbi:hypothetical protein BJ980_001326 [Nocardioides daedukensis]|uniref:Uncharacterized protein n=1 Tax=Nocardioides daedukensis TaxID=634462 RepID=A0A7Y9S1E6_9ACTN|nr:hypothetical protein [Nocardioides daedukensis]NYG58403.1 hypothetical protein [Nocardioides daedukensis]
MSKLIKRCTGEDGRIDKQMIHARGYSDNGMYGHNDVNPNPLGGSLLIKAKGFWVKGRLSGRHFWVAVFWRGELEDRVQIRGWDSEWVRETLALHQGDTFSLTPVGPHPELRLDNPLSILTALLEMGGREAEWYGDKPPGYPRDMGCIPTIES